VVSARTINRDSFNAWSLHTNPLWSPRSFSTSSSSFKQNKSQAGVTDLQNKFEKLKTRHNHIGGLI